MEMFRNFGNFIYSSKDNFPSESCIIHVEGAKDIFDSKDIYMVLWIDVRFKNEKNITYAKPYIRKEEGKSYFGWISLDGNSMGNVENTSAYYGEYVIGFIKVNDVYIQNDYELFNEYVDKCEEL